MMTLNRWLLLSFASLIFTGFAGTVFRSQASDRSMPMAIHTSTQSVQSNAIAQSMTDTRPTVVKSGTFQSGEHPTQGTVQIVSQNGKLFLELDKRFQTSSMGPDLVVILHRSSNVLGSTKPPAYPLKSGEYVFLAPLKKFSGAQRYAIPANINLADYKSAAIWCRKFNATFGAARLQ